MMIRATTPNEQAQIRTFIAAQWGEPRVIGHGVEYYPERLPALVAEEAGGWVGLLTYTIMGDECEIVTIDSLRQGQGIGVALIEVAIAAAREAHCRRLWLITTNDNLNALRFYQKRGFTLVAIYPNAVNRSRLLKPSIPLMGEFGIPLRDEIELELWL